MESEFFFFNKLKWNILLKPKVIHPAQDVLKEVNHTTVTMSMVLKQKATSHQKLERLHTTHTKKRELPPIMITKSN